MNSIHKAVEAFLDQNELHWVRMNGWDSFPTNGKPAQSRPLFFLCKKEADGRSSALIGMVTARMKCGQVAAARMPIQFEQPDNIGAARELLLGCYERILTQDGTPIFPRYEPKLRDALCVVDRPNLMSENVLTKLCGIVRSADREEAD